ncbi:hypothetical protein BDN72DRAFT_878230 [Pluteus cervinus]|uniref:Uncharacterized protein n=1 Tax=Pluteus cervinus TaxID=181527 RepID=A0ACD3AWT3_9AGAR|nr:hypothetical protein BDN72DRAFT_878230 [Pluteus cervinus]
MPLRIVRIPKLTKEDVIHTAIAATSFTKDLSNLSCFPPAAAAISIVSLILQTVQDVQSNKEACHRLARRCARILSDINDQMEGRWDTAPPLLVKNLQNFEITLNSILHFMKAQAQASWGERFMRKFSIENALAEYHSLLDDAAQSFQLATLINIHYAVASSSSDMSKNQLKRPSVSSEETFVELPPYTPPEPLPSPRIAAAAATLDSPTATSSLEIVSNVASIHENEDDADELLFSEGVLEDHGFPQYHPSQLHLKSRSTTKDGWWSNMSVAEVDRRDCLVKHYDGPQQKAMKEWLRDVKILQNTLHPNLPQMVGYSSGDAPTPFIVLSHVQTRSAQNMLLNVLKRDGVAACASLVLKFYSDISDATFYLQRQRGLSDSQTQDFIGSATFKVNGSNSVIMGLPPPQSGGWYTARNYGLTESLKGAIMEMLPRKTIQYQKGDNDQEMAWVYPWVISAQTRASKQASVHSNQSRTERDRAENEEELTKKIGHLIGILNGLLPKDKESPDLSSRVRSLIADEGSEAVPPSLRQLRLSNLEANSHDHSWSQNSAVPAHQLAVGDFGYIPTKQDFNKFVKLGNIYTDELADLATEVKSYGSQWCWKDVPIRRTPMDPYLQPDNVSCWPISVPPTAQIDCQIVHEQSMTSVPGAWHFMLDHAQFLGDEFSISPESIILVTRAGTIQDFYIRDFTIMPPQIQKPLVKQPGFQHMHHKQFHHNPFPLQHSIPTIMYLMTSFSSKFAPYWSHQPIAIPNGTPTPTLQRNWTYRIGWCTGFVSWIQLHPEDFHSG